MQHVISFFGSYGWGGGAMAQFKTLTEKGNLTLVEPTVEVKGGPTNQDLERCRALGLAMAEAVLR